MATTAQIVIDRAAILLHDTSYVRWPVAEMINFLNDGQRDAVLIKPDVFTKTIVFPLAGGVRQPIVSLTDIHLLLNITRNIAADGVTPGRVIRVTTASLLDDVDLDWHSSTPGSTIVHYTYDPATPFVFQTYPPAVAGTNVEMVYSAIPPLITLGADFISVPDSLSNAMVHYLCYRAMSKDIEYGDNATKAAAHYQMFKEALGVGSAEQLQRSPTLAAAPFNPTNPTSAK